LKIKKGEKVMILGKNRSGKTSLLEAIAGTISLNQEMYESLKNVRIPLEDGNY
jgi:ABC-type branched-subunit amino acid transport system ATPase component